MPVVPVASTIALAYVSVVLPASNVALTLPVVSPMVMTLLFAPKALALVLPLTVPALMVKPPVKVLAPESVRVPVPALASATVPLPFCMIPEKVVEVLSPPAVKVIEPTAVLVTVPAPASEPIISFLPFKSNVPVTVTALVSGITPAAPSFNVPALTVVTPV